MTDLSTFDEFQDFLKKYDLDPKLADEEFAKFKIKKDDFNEETLENSIKGLVCKGYAKKQLGRYLIKDLLFYLETEYKEDGNSETTPLVFKVYTEQPCSETYFQKNLEKFINKIMDHYSGKRKLTDFDALELTVRYEVDLPEQDYEEIIRFYAFLTVEDLHEDGEYVYITFGFWG
jgi:hypothetical protein